MTTLAPTVTLSPKKLVPSDDFLWRMSVDAYHALVRAGAFAPDEEVELIHGYVVKKMSKNPLHAKANQWLLILLTQLIGLNQGWFLSVQDPLTLQDSEPEPDLAVVRGTPSSYEGHPTAADVAIAIEVADSSLEYDEGVKKQMYAFNGIVEYWIVNIRAQQIQVYTEPYQTAERADYHRQVIYTLDEVVPVQLEGQKIGNISVAEIFA